MNSNDYAVRTVLVVEDNEVLRGLVRDCLEQAGYQVIAAADGVLGLSAFKRHVPIGLVLTDVQMPNMNGVQLAHHVKELDRAVPVLFMSGSDPQVDWGHGCIQKPFRAQELVARVRTVFPINIDQTA